MKWNFLLIFSIIVSILMACSHQTNIRSRIGEESIRREDLRKDRKSHQSNETFIGLASYYGEEFNGNKTANGETYDMNGLTGAHRSLPFGTICKVTNLENQRSVIIRINDRGPFVPNRILDLSRGAAAKLHGLSAGVLKVKIEILSYPEE